MLNWNYCNEENREDYRIHSVYNLQLCGLQHSQLLLQRVVAVLDIYSALQAKT